MGAKQDKHNNNHKAGSVLTRFKLKKQFPRQNSATTTAADDKTTTTTMNVAGGRSPKAAAISASTAAVANDKTDPQRYPELFESEKDSDVTFLVGTESNIWRLPAHKFVLVAANPVFAAMLKGPMSSNDQKEEVPIEDLDPKAFENVLRFLYTNDLKLTSIDLTLATLFAAEKYMIVELIELCLQHLEVNLVTNNILSIYPRIRFFALSRQDSWPSVQQQHNVVDPLSPSNPYIPLLNRCLEHIDLNADQVLLLEDFEGLSECELSDIVFRDSLLLKTELNVFKALQVWATQQCKSKQKEITGENKRRVLGSALYSVRYILMSRDDFMAGPYQSDLLNKEEKLWFLKRIDGQSKCDPPHHIADRQRYLERKRGQSLTSSNDHTKDCSLGQEMDNQSTATDRHYSNKRCCRVTKIFTEVFLCFSLFFD